MEITFSIKMTHESIPSLIGLLEQLHKAYPDTVVSLLNPPGEFAPEHEHKHGTASTPVPASIPAPVPAQTPAPAPAPAPTTAQDYTIEQIGRAAQSFMDADPGNINVLLDSLQQMGVQAVTHLTTPDMRAGFVARMQAAGMKI